MFWFVFFSLFIKSWLCVIWAYGMPANSGLLSLVLSLSPEYAAVVFLVLAWGIFWPKKIAGRFWIAADILVSLLYLADLIYFRAFQVPFNIYALWQIGRLPAMISCTLPLIHLRDLFLLADLPFLFFWISPSMNHFRQARLFLPLMILAFFISSRNFSAVVGSPNPGDYMINLSPISNHFFAIYTSLHDRETSLTPVQKATIAGWLAANAAQYPAPAEPALQGIYRGRNLIVVQVESLENFVINYRTGDQEITPELNKLLKHSLYFPNIYEQVAEGNSSDAELLVNASVYPLTSGSAFIRFPHSTYASLPKNLREHGYSTTVITGDSQTFWNHQQALPALGYDRFIHQDLFKNREIIGLGISDRALFAESLNAVKLLAAQDRPYLLDIITLTSHDPFRLPAAMQQLSLPPNLANTACGSYLQSIHYTDAALGDFLSRLQADHQLDNTVVAIFGDHQGIHKYFPQECTGLLPENNKKIPLIIFSPDLSGRTIPVIGGQVDFLPTLEFLMGSAKKENANRIMGHNLFQMGAGFALLSDGQIIGQATNTVHREKSRDIADMIIRGNYFQAEKTVAEK